jgi:hypothetical protein
MTQPSPTPVTYKFDVVSVTTFDITTAYGEAAARQAAESIEAYEPGCGIDAAGTKAPDVEYDVTCVAPRGKPYLVETEGESGEELPEPITGDNRSILQSELDDAIDALEGDSNDAEHDALYGLAETVAQVLGTGFNPHLPGEDLTTGYAGDENEGEPDTTTR